MPLSCGDIDYHNRSIRAQFYCIRTASFQVVIEFLNYATTQASHCFVGISVPVNGQRAARLNGV